MTSDPGATGDGVLCVGEALLAMAPAASGPLESVDGFVATVAGSELNTAVGLTRLGLSAAFAGAVGDDGFGRRVRRHLRAEGVSTEHMSLVEGAPTGVLFKARDLLGGDPEVLYYRAQSPMGQGRWEAAQLAAELRAGRWRWVHTTGITWMLHEKTRDTLRTLLEAAKSSGTTISFDVNIRLKLGPIEAWRLHLQSVLPYAACLICGDAEGARLAGRDGIEAFLEWAGAAGFRGTEWVWRKGADGAEALRSGRRERTEAWPVSQVVDTVGAGDGFTAGYIAASLWGWPLDRVLRLASLIGGYAVASPGDHDGYPDRARALMTLGETAAGPTR